MTHDLFTGRSVATASDPECPPGREVLTLYVTLDELACINRAINAATGEHGEHPVEAVIAMACRQWTANKERGKCINLREAAT